MSSGIDIQVIGDDRGVQRMLRGLDTALNPVVIAAFLGAEVAPYFALRAKNRFASEGDDVTGKWLPLHEATERIRAAGRMQGMWSVGDAHPINIRTHEMEEYVTSGLADVPPTAFGATLTYPRQSTGATGGLKKKMQAAQKGMGRTPARPVLGINERDVAFVLTAIAFHVKKVAGKRRFP